jgi:hypothetical protein
MTVLCRSGKAEIVLAVSICGKNKKLGNTLKLSSCVPTNRKLGSYIMEEKNA